MKEITFCTVGTNPALLQARNTLTAWGYHVVNSPDRTVTHMLLPVPSMDEANRIRNGPILMDVLSKLKEETTIMGGLLPNLDFPSVDFLKDEYYTAENASITAHCALKLILQNIHYTLNDVPILIIGWGRIGKCLVNLLASTGAEITVAARSEKDRAMLHALGHHAVSIELMKADRYTIIINTVPATVLDRNDAAPSALCLDLASVKGILGENVFWERGLPGRVAAESSGILIAKTALRYALRKE